MRLIDADALEKDIRARMSGFVAEREIFESIVDLQPIAYNLEDVKIQIENEIMNSKGNLTKIYAFERALDIVNGKA